ncbi:MAG: 2-C-methyl-D-erythritol 4-phosphate cytidylyltransferase [Candidatus Puniceispirillaceae bacterium]
MNAEQDKMDFVILAAGNGKRFLSADPSTRHAKQFELLAGKMVLLHSLDTISQWPSCGQIVIVLPQDGVEVDILNSLKTAASATHVSVSFTPGGTSRSASTLNGLKALSALNPNTLVAIHDAARPSVPHQVLNELLSACTGGADGAIPSLLMTDTVKHVDKTNKVLNTVDRSSLRRAQTPQAFSFDKLFRLHQTNAEKAGKQPVTDDASLAEAAGLTVVCVDGSSQLEKITYAEDLNIMQNQQTEMRTASGFDVHRFSTEKPGPIMICGVAIEHEHGLMAHSDGDVGLHALCDAVLGTLSMGDIGQHFPPSDPKWNASSSDQFLQFALEKVKDAGGYVTLLDVTLICEDPKIGPHRNKIRQRLTEITGLPLHRLSLKATTSERLGFTGRGEGIAALAQATVCLPASYGKQE